MPPLVIEINKNTWLREKAAVLAVMTPHDRQAGEIEKALHDAFQQGAQVVIHALSNGHVKLVE